jgi:diacylglycerol kinase (ATP)
MHLTLVHNPSAGEEWPAKGDLLNWCKEAGHQAFYQSSKEKACRDTLKDPGDLVLVAGGDGTVRKVALRLAGRNIPMALVPMGTANNIARTLGIHGHPRDLIHGLTNAARKPFDLGVASGDWGEKRFVESIGFGLFAQLICVDTLKKEHGSSEEDDRHSRMQNGLHLLQEILHNYPARHFEIELDGETLSGPHLLVEILNIRSIGPNLLLAPEANPGDGLLDIALLPETRRKELALALSNHRRDGEVLLKNMVARQARELRIRWEQTELHLDDSSCPEAREKLRKPGGEYSMTVRVEPHALDVLIQR